ncbi:hypothetical protein EV426DRAFT_686075 [Tirmania nivea]|nr:hypothetical protein EV426DRAFT_686075 [Tirmania nivea]
MHNLRGRMTSHPETRVDSRDSQVNLTPWASYVQNQITERNAANLKATQRISNIYILLSSSEGAVEVGEVRLHRIPLLLLSLFFSPNWRVKILPCPGVPDELLALLAVVGAVEGDVEAVLRGVVTHAEEWALSYGGATPQCSVSVLDLGLGREDESEQSEDEIRFRGVGREVWLTGGSKDEGGGVGGGCCSRRDETNVGLGMVAMVWDGEMAGIRGNLERAEGDKEILILSDSQAAIMSLVKAGKRGRARTHDIKRIMSRLSSATTKIHFGWVKSHIGIEGNERADTLAKAGAQKRGVHIITEGGIRQWYKEMCRRERKVFGYGLGRVVRWNRRAVVNYSRCRSGKGDFAVWKRTLGEEDGDATCRHCRKYEESGRHIAFVCGEGEWLGRRFGSWEDVDCLGSTVGGEVVGGRDTFVDLAESFFTRLRSC